MYVINKDSDTFEKYKYVKDVVSKFTAEDIATVQEILKNSDYFWQNVIAFDYMSIDGLKKQVSKFNFKYGFIYHFEKNEDTENTYIIKRTVVEAKEI